MKTVQEIKESSDKDKILQYINIAGIYASTAEKIADEHTDTLFCKKAADHVVAESIRAEFADCEYAAYVLANSCEQWVEEIKNHLINVRNEDY